MMKQLNKTNLGWLILIALMVVVLFVGVSSNVISPFYQITLVTILINVILAIGLNLVIGFSGQFSLGHAGFMAIGAYSGAIIGDKIEGLPGFCRVIRGDVHFHRCGADRRHSDTPFER